MTKVKHDIVYKPDAYNDIWYVKGGHWQGRVMKSGRAGRFICNCLQYTKYHGCWHIRAVKDALEERGSRYGNLT